MKIPHFVPIIETERRKRELTGVIIEAFMWAYSALLIVKVFFYDMFLRFLEYYKYTENPSKISTIIVDFFNYDSRNFFMTDFTLTIIAVMGAVFGCIVAFTGKSFGSWIASISKLHVNNAEDSIKIEKHWKYAKKEGILFLVFTFIAGWHITSIDLGKLIDGNGLNSAARLSLDMMCGVPGVGAEVAKDISLHNGLKSLVNTVLGLSNSIGLTNEPIGEITKACIPTNANYYSMALGKLVESVYLAFMATILSLPIAFVLSFFAARNLTRHSFFMRSFYVLIRMYMNITRSIEPLIWATIFAAWIGIGPYAGSVALMVHSISSLVKQYSEAIEEVDNGPIEALMATGADRISTVWYAVVPQIVLPYLAFTIFRWDINVRMATIIGLIGGGGIGGILIQEQQMANWTAVGTLAFLIFMVVWIMDMLSAKIREAIQ